MKLTKHILAALLALALALTLALPVFAENEPNPVMPVITVQPVGQTIKHGDSFTLSVEVSVPAGVKVVSYFWQEAHSGGAGAGTESVLRLSPGDPLYPTAYQPYYAASGHYYCTITAIEVDAEGNPVGAPWNIISQEAEVTVLAERDMYFWEVWGQRLQQGAGGFFLGFFWLVLTPLASPFMWMLGRILDLFA